MKRSTGLASLALSAAVVVIGAALSRGARAGDDGTDLAERVKALEARLAAAEAALAKSDGMLSVRGLTVADSKGRPRIELGAPHDLPELTIRDADGKPAVRIGFETQDTPQIALLGPDRVSGARLAASRQGATLSLDGGADHRSTGGAGPASTAILKAPVDGIVGLGLWGGPGDQNERSHFGSWIWKDGTIAWGGGLRSAGRTGFLLKYDRAGKSTFEMRDAAESVLWQMPTEKDPLKEGGR